uniref:Uncharacterized protein n=1 Tax=Cacopsylla melanoneura TaxID=428564 RepID=A0A8D8X708_9HEMI
MFQLVKISTSWGWLKNKEHHDWDLYHACCVVQITSYQDRCQCTGINVNVPGSMSMYWDSHIKWAALYSVPCFSLPCFKCFVYSVSYVIFSLYNLFCFKCFVFVYCTLSPMLSFPFIIILF